MLNYNKFKLAVRMIGCNIQTYGHFDTYMIPDENGNGILENYAKAYPYIFLSHVEIYYTNKKMLNKDYGDDLKEQNAMKRFLLSKPVTEEILKLGEEWIKTNLE